MPAPAYPERNWAAEVLIAGLDPFLLSIPCATPARQSVAFCLLGPWRYVLCNSQPVAGYSIRFWEPMPRYYFQYRDGSSIFEDDVGEVFADASSARQHATKIARELAQGGEPANAAIVVNEGGQHLFDVPLAEQGD
jgi:hypothetical protein